MAPMDLAELTARIEYVSAGYADHYGVERSNEWVLLKLTEELGELVQASLTATGQGRDRGLSTEDQQHRVEAELADVVCMCLVFAARNGINLEEAIASKWFRYEQFHRDRGFTTPTTSVDNLGTACGSLPTSGADPQ